jgi:hypothetical protein
VIFVARRRGNVFLGCAERNFADSAVLAIVAFAQEKGRPKPPFPVL